MKVAALNSGSNGNCYVFSSGEEVLMVDAGLSCKETEKRMDRLGIPMDQVRALLITHEHSDHVFGIRGLLKKYNLTVHVSEATWSAAGIPVTGGNIVHFRSDEVITIGGFRVRSFRTKHDAADSHGFIITHGNTTAGVFTDIGAACRRVRKNFSECHLAFLECNYEEELLENGNYPRMLKERIRGGHGHLSNRQAMELFRDHRHPNLQHIFLSHLSRENNSPERALEWFNDISGNTTIDVAGRYRETAIIEVDGGSSWQAAGMQLKLF